MATNSTDAAANPLRDGEATRNLASISPFFIVKDLQVSIAYYVERLWFQLEFQGKRVFANLPGSSQVVVGDRESTKVLARWPTHGCGRNYPMALDERSGRVFIGCRSPALLHELDAANGNAVASVQAVGDTDDLFYDAARQRLYVIGGDGFVDVVQREGDTLRRLAQVPTRDGARTGLWVADQNRLYVAVPSRSGQPAEVRIFEAQS